MKKFNRFFFAFDKTKKIYNIWVLLYLLMLLIALTGNLLSYHKAKSSSKIQVHDYCQNILQEFTNQTDAILTLNNHIVSSLTSHPALKSIFSEKEFQYSPDIIQFQKYISSIKLFSQTNFDVFVLLQNSSYAVSDTYAGKLSDFYKMYYPDGVSFNHWYDNILGAKFGDCAKVLSPENQPCLEFYYHQPLSSGKNADTILVIRFNELDLYQHVNNTLFADSTGLFIFNNSDDCVSANNAGRPVPVFDNEKNTYISPNSDEFIWQSASSINSWHYVMSLPKKAYNSQIRHMNITNLINISLSLVLIAALGYYLIIHYHKKISKLAERAGKLFNAAHLDQYSDEYKVLENTVSYYLQMHQKHEVTEAIIHKQKCCNYIENLMKGIPYFKGDNTLITWNSHLFCAVIFKIHNFEVVFGNNDNIKSEEKFNSVFIILQNVMEELLNKSYLCHVLHFDGQVSALVNLAPDQADSFYSDLDAAVKEAQLFIEDNFNFTFTVFVGGICSGLSMIQNSYKKAKDILRYTTDLNTSTVISEYLQEIPTQLSDQLSLAFHKEELMLDAVKKGNCDAALSSLQEIIANVNMNHHPEEFHKILISDIESQLRKIIFLNYENEIEYLSLKFDSSFDFSNVNEFYDKLAVLIKEICSLVEKNTETDDTSSKAASHDVLIDHIISYIEKEYRDSNLSITSIGEYFNIAPYYASNIFKKAMGVGIAEYIGHYRIECAKNLLKESNIPISKIATQVGFLNDRTFFRTFTKHESVTPGQYRASFKA